MSKAKKILSLLSRGNSIKQVAKATKSSEAYVYYVRWIDKKGKTAPKKAKKKAVYKSERSKLIKAVFDTVKDVKAVKETKPTKLIIQPQHKDTAMKLLAELDAAEKKTALEKKPAKIITHSQFVKDALDLVNKPPHYTDGGIDTLKFIEAKDLNYRLGNVVKYISRTGKKVDSDPLQDLEKARFYLDREIEARRDA